ncbi:MAG: galactokinase family protein, partial [Armatimonadota bacterium]
MVHASAPGRGGIIGNPSDIYGGTVVSCAISERAEAVVTDSPRLIFDIYGHFQQVNCPEDLDFSPELHYLD